MTHPHKHFNTAGEIQKKLGSGVRFTRYDLQVVIHAEKVKKADSSPFHYLMKQTSTHPYSDIFVDDVVHKVQNDEGYLKRCRESYRKSVG